MSKIVSMFFLKLNTSKTELIIFSNKHQAKSNNTKLKIILDDNLKEEKSQVKHLEVTLDHLLTFQD